MLDEAKMVEKIRKLAANGQSAFAARHGVSPAYVSNILAGDRQPGITLPASLGYERVIMYRKK